MMEEDDDSLHEVYIIIYQKYRKIQKMEKLLIDANFDTSIRLEHEQIE
jgi:hypothetical protein